MRFHYFVSGQAGSGVHETLCLLRDVYRLRASPSVYAGDHSGTGETKPEIWRVNPAALASLRCFPPHSLGPYRLIYLRRPACDREKKLREAGIPFPIALRHLVCDLYAYRGWEAQSDLILQDASPQICAMHLYDYILRSEGCPAENKLPSAFLDETHLY